MDQGSYLVKEITAPEGYTMSDAVYRVTLDRMTLSFSIGEVVNQKIADPTPPDPTDPTDPADPADPDDPANPRPGKAPSAKGGAAAVTGDAAMPVFVAIGAAMVLALCALAVVAVKRRASRR